MYGTKLGRLVGFMFLLAVLLAAVPQPAQAECSDPTCSACEDIPELCESRIWYLNTWMEVGTTLVCVGVATSTTPVGGLVCSLVAIYALQRVRMEDEHCSEAPDYLQCISDCEEECADVC